MDRIVGGVSVAEVSEMGKAFALEEEIRAGWRYYNQVVEGEKEKEAQVFMAESEEDESGEEEQPIDIEDEFFRPEDLPKDAQNRKNFYNFTLMSLEGGVGERTAAKQATGEKNNRKLASLPYLIFNIETRRKYYVKSAAYLFKSTSSQSSALKSINYSLKWIMSKIILL